MASDISYFEKLIFFLQKDTELKKFFHDKNYFALPKIDPKEIDKTAEKPIDKGLWIYPGETVSNSDKNLQCTYKGTHTFYVTILLKCNRDRFMAIKQDDELKLKGPVMEMTCIRAAVKDAIRRFGISCEKAVPPPNFRFINWQKDEMIQYMEENKCGMLNATSIFNLELI